MLKFNKMSEKWKLYLVWSLGATCGAAVIAFKTGFILSFLIGALGMFISYYLFKKL